MDPYLTYSDTKNNGNGFFVGFCFLLGLLLCVQFIMPPQQNPTTIEQNENATKTPLPPTLKYPVESRTLESDQLKVNFSNAGGGRVTDVFIKDPDRYAEHGDFIRSQKSKDSKLGGLLPISVSLPSFGVGDETQFEVVSPADDSKSASFAYVDAAYQKKFVKTFKTTDDPYVLHATFELTNLTAAPIDDTLSMALFIKQIEGEEPGLFTPGSYVAAKCYADDEMEYVDATDTDENEKFTKNIKWFAVDESYFAIAASVDHASQCEIRNDNGVLKSAVEIPVSVQPGETKSIEFDLYLGPKESKYLGVWGDERDLKSIIDYGWIEILAKPMAYILDTFQRWTGNWGLAIILLTLIVRALLWPIAQKSQISMMRMSKVAPLMQELQEKYKDDPQTLQQKQLEFYRDNQINPFGCLPLLLQMPIFFALYRCIFVTGGLYHAEFVLWIHDLSAPDPYFVLPILSVALLVVQQLLTPSAVKNTQQKVMMIAMPVMFGVMMLFLPSGLCLYMVVSSLFSMAQSFYVRKLIAKEDEDKKTPEVEVIPPDQMSSKDRRAAKRRES